MSSGHSVSSADRKILFFFMGAWLLLNLIQASFTGIEADEAYYWIFSRHLDWGYFDHPPLVALSVKLGEGLGHGPLFTRLGTLLLSAGSVYFGFKALPDELKNAKSYVLCFASIIILNVYGFIVTPDSSLLFFTALFFYAYKRYLSDQGLQNVFFLSLSIAGLLYSKYQGVLPVLFVLVSNPRLVLKGSAWLVVLFTTILFLPHIWWQVEHGWPTVQYHLFERGRTVYKIEKTTNYILGQLLIWGPFTTIPALWNFFKQKTTGLYYRAHVFTFWGVLLFFLFTSFKKNTEPQWTLPAAFSFIVLMLLMLERASEKRRRIFTILLGVNVTLILMARILFMSPNPAMNKVEAFHLLANGKNMADSVRNRVGNGPLVFVNSYQLASLYQYFYPSAQTASYNTVYGRKNHFNLSGDEKDMNNQAVYSVSKYRLDSTDTEIKDRYFTLYLHRVSDFRSLNGLKVRLGAPFKKAKAGQEVPVRFVLKNEGGYAVNGSGLFINCTFFKTKWDYYSPETKWFIEADTISPNYQQAFHGVIKMPSQPGKYRLIFSVVQPGLNFGGAFSSPFYDVKIE